MTIKLVLFAILQLLASSYAWWRGGWPERVVAAAMPLALVGGWMLPFSADEYTRVEYARLGIDLALGAAIYAIALTSDRYWPLWMSALQILAITTHGVRGYDADLLPLAYTRLIAWISYPMLAMLVIGAHRHATRGRHQNGAKTA